MGDSAKQKMKLFASIKLLPFCVTMI